MSKLNLRFSYKESCILKHALRDNIDSKKQMICFNKATNNSLGKELCDKFSKEIEEEEKTLEKLTEQIDRKMGRR